MQERRGKAVLEIFEEGNGYRATVLNPDIHYPIKVTWAVKSSGHYVLMERSLTRNGQGNTNIFEVVCRATHQEVAEKLYIRAKSYVESCDIDDKTGYSLRDTVV